MTPSDEPRYHGITNETSKPTEKVAVWNVDRDADLLRKSELLDLTMSRLPSIQREVIQRSYKDAEGVFDYISCGEMGISNSTYRWEKTEVIYVLASALRLQKFEEIGEVEVS